VYAYDEPIFQQKNSVIYFFRKEEVIKDAETND